MGYCVCWVSPACPRAPVRSVAARRGPSLSPFSKNSCSLLRARSSLGGRLRPTLPLLFPPAMGTPLAQQESFPSLGLRPHVHVRAQTHTSVRTQADSYHVHTLPGAPTERVDLAVTLATLGSLQAQLLLLRLTGNPRLPRCPGDWPRSRRGCCPPGHDLRGWRHPGQAENPSYRSCQCSLLLRTTGGLVLSPQAGLSLRAAQGTRLQVPRVHCVPPEPPGQDGAPQVSGQVLLALLTVGHSGGGGWLGAGVSPDLRLLSPQ